jgi:acyl carrier protein
MPLETKLIEQQVRTFIIQNYLFGRDDGLLNGQSFVESGIIDSTGVLELVAFLQNTYCIKVADEELIPENLDSVNKILEYLRSKTGSNGRAGDQQA